MNDEVFDHSRFVHTHATLLELLDENAAEEVINKLLGEALGHLKQQFAREEQAMQAAQFGPLDAHKKDHDQALERLSARIAQWHETHDRQALLAYLEGPFSDWFVRHVNSRDFITAQRLSLGV
ncbi:MAG: hemerythrin family protein [Sideroxydans sp.]|nr:hemerythrin family protein [Sideroxydans sp.]